MIGEYINYYGIPCLCTIVRDGYIKTIVFKSEFNKSTCYKHKDMIELGFIYYAGHYIKNVNIEA